MIYNTRNPSNETTESQKEKKACFNAHFQYIQSKITVLNKMWSLKSLPMLSVRKELVCMQYNTSVSQALFCFALIILRMASLGILFLCSVGQ